MNHKKTKWYGVFIALSFLSTQTLAQTNKELQLWYNQPAKKWTDALPIGNGRLGGMIYGGTGTDHIQFNEETLWTDGPREHAREGAAQYLGELRRLLAEGKQKEAEQLAEAHFMGKKSHEDDYEKFKSKWLSEHKDGKPPLPRYEADYQPFGDLWLQFDSTTAPVDYRRELDLETAVSRVSYSAGGVHYTREYLASAPQQTIVIHLTADKKGSISCKAILNSPHRSSTVKKIDNNTLALAVKVDDGVLHGESYLQVETQGGKIDLSEAGIVITNADEATLYLTAATNFKNYKDVTADPAAQCKKVMSSLQQATYAGVKAAHIRDYQQYFNTLSFGLGKGQTQLPTDQRIRQFTAATDPALAALYLQYARYLLISSSRPGTQPANLQGIWNDQLSPPWGSKYTTNINLEMNYWPAEVLHLTACNEPLFKMAKEVAEAGSRTAKAHYDAPGWVLHHNTDLWRGTAPINASNHGIWVTGGAWISHHLWEHYLFTQDKEFLKKEAYPVMKEAARFFEKFLVKDPKTGRLISTPSNSPEQGGLVAGPTMDHQLIRDLYKNCISASELLGTDAAFRKTLQEQYAQIAPNQIGKHGQLQEWMEDVDDITSEHRHVSHLWGVFPGNDITWDESPELMKAARQSLLYRGDGGTGWSLAWKINFWARFKDGNHALIMVNNLLTPAEDLNGKVHGGSYTNLFDAHPPFQIDGNFGGASGIAEMLVQSHMPYIDLLPALPDTWQEGTIKGICARDGFVLDLSWKNGKLDDLTITSVAGKECKLHYGKQQISFPTQAGKKYHLNGTLKRI